MAKETPILPPSGLQSNTDTVTPKAILPPRTKLTPKTILPPSTMLPKLSPSTKPVAKSTLASRPKTKIEVKVKSPKPTPSSLPEPVPTTPQTSLVVESHLLTATVYRALTRKALKQHCIHNGLDCKGSKEELVERLARNTNAQDDKDRQLREKREQKKRDKKAKREKAAKKAETTSSPTVAVDENESGLGRKKSKKKALKSNGTADKAKDESQSDLNTSLSKAIVLANERDARVAESASSHSSSSASSSSSHPLVLRRPQLKNKDTTASAKAISELKASLEKAEEAHFSQIETLQSEHVEKVSNAVSTVLKEYERKIRNVNRRQQNILKKYLAALTQPLEKLGMCIKDIQEVKKLAVDLKKHVQDLKKHFESSNLKNSEAKKAKKLTVAPSPSTTASDSSCQEALMSSEETWTDPDLPSDPEPHTTPSSGSEPDSSPSPSRPRPTKKRKTDNTTPLRSPTLKPAETMDSHRKASGKLQTQSHINSPPVPTTDSDAIATTNNPISPILKKEKRAQSPATITATPTQRQPVWIDTNTSPPGSGSRAPKTPVEPSSSHLPAPNSSASRRVSFAMPTLLPSKRHWYE